MIVETNFSVPPKTPFPYDNKKGKIHLSYKLVLIISGTITALSLIIGWILWFTVASDAIKYYIDWFNKKISASSELQISFLDATITALTAAGLTIFFTIIPFIFLKDKNLSAIFFSLLTFICASFLVISVTLFFIARKDALIALLNKDDQGTLNTTGMLVISFLPWIIAAISAFLTLITSAGLTINIIVNKNKRPLLKPKKTITDDATVNIDSIIIPPTSEQPQPLTVNNTTEQPTVYQEQTPATIISDDKQPPLTTSTTIIYDNKAEAATANNTTAYVSEAVVTPTTKNVTASTTPTTNQNTTITNDNNPDNLVFEGQNQGGFEVNSSDTTIENSAMTTNNTSPNEQILTNRPASPHEITEPSYPPQEITKKPKTSVVEEEVISVPEVATVEWTLEEITAVWEKAEIIDGVSDKLYRKDYSGAWMFRDAFTTNYQDTDSEKTYAWTIVLHRPASQGGTKEFYNLDPMNVVNAKSKGEDYPRWTTKLSAKGNENIFKIQTWKART